MSLRKLQGGLGTVDEDSFTYSWVLFVGNGCARKFANDLIGAAANPLELPLPRFFSSLTIPMSYNTPQSTTRPVFR